MEEESTQRGGTEAGSKPPSKPPAFFVLLHPSQGDGSKEEGILVANRDVSSVAPFITNGPSKSKSDFFLSANCTSGEITVTLDNNNMWNEFYRCNTEMVLTKQGRRMFPYCRYWVSGLNPDLKYILVMDISPLDNYRYKWNGKLWEPAGKADPHVLGRVFIHPESPSTGQYWMHQPVSFYKLKLTNNILDQEGHIILHSMHRYLPRLHVVPAEKATDVIQLNGPDVHTFTFPQTEFIAVTAYQNFQITQLKIDCNPFAKGFREGTVMGRTAKESKLKPADQEAADSSSGKNAVEETEDCGNMNKLQELFKLSEYLNGDKENDSEQDVTKPASQLGKLSKEAEEVIKRVNEHFSRASLPEPVEQPRVEIKKEPEDDYDYDKPVTMEGVSVKQEPSDTKATDDHYNSDVDYPILEKHFAKFKEEPYLDGKNSTGSPTGVAKAKLLKLEPGSAPVVHLEPCAAQEDSLKPPELIKCEDALQDIDIHNTTMCKEEPDVLPSPSVEEDGYVKRKRRRICKNRIDEIYATLQTALRTSRGPKRKFPSLFPKPSVTPTPGSEGTVAPVAKKRGRPPKPKLSKVGRPPKIHEAPRLFPDFNPDLEDVDGVLFVAFSSKEALDVHTENKPTDTVSSSYSAEAPITLTDEMQKILGLERQLLTHLKTMKYRQVIHPALQQVGLKLNIVDRSMIIDLRYLGVQLPLPYITNDTKYDEDGLCGQGLQFVSRTGKTTDYTKIKGWRDKFSTESATSSQKSEAIRSETTVKNLSAFCSDELDEYLEKEAKLMGDLKELTQNEPESSISYQLPTKSSSYVRTLDSVLKKQAQQATASVSAAEPFPVPRKKRKYTRRVPLTKPQSRPRTSLPAPVTVKEKPTKPYSPVKKELSASHFMNKAMATPLSKMEYFSKSQPMVKVEGEHSGTVQRSLPTAIEDEALKSIQQVHLQSQQIVSKPIGFSKTQWKLLDLEEAAVWEGKPRTYITEERAELSLSTLLTAQASLKNKPVLKLTNRRSNACNNEFCRLGCICSSISCSKQAVTHCRHETCMFSGDCLQSKLYSRKDGFKVKVRKATDDESESDSPLVPPKPVQAEHGVDNKQPEEHQEMSADGLQDASAKAKKRKSSEIDDGGSDVRTPECFPIWNRSDVAYDAEPLCIPEQAEFLELRIVHKGHIEKVKSPGGGKPGRPSTVAQVHPDDPVYMYFDSMMTCARVRVYPRKVPAEKKVEDQSASDTGAASKEQDLKLSKSKEPEKEVIEEEGVVEKKRKPADNNGPTKLIEIISESKELNIMSQDVPSDGPQSLKLGSFQFELKQENKSEEKSASSTVCSRVKISVSAEKQETPTAPKPKPVKWKAENVKPPDEESEESPADGNAKSHGGKGLPFYTKVNPAGKLVARLKVSDMNEAKLVEVNGKNYPQAKLLLGQMGALHPANRLAAYVTHRLQPSSLLHLSKVNEVNGKKIAKSPSDVMAEKSQDALPSQQNKTGIVASSDARAMTLTSVPSTKDSGLTPPVLTPAVIRPLPSTGNTSPGSPSSKPASNKSIAASIPNLLISPKVSQSGSVASQLGLTVTSPLTIKTVTASAVSAVSPSGTSPGKRLGPRLLLIPVNSASAPARPVQCLQTSPGQKMVLQPIKSANGATLFRHPSGQLIQLVPLQQANSSNAQQRRQQIVIRNPGPVLGVRLPLPTKPKAAASSSVSAPATAAPQTSSPASIYVVSPSKASPNKAGVTILSQNPPILSPPSTLALKPSPTSSNSETPLSFLKLLTGSAHALPTSNAMPLQSEGVSLAIVPPSTSENDSLVKPATKPNITPKGKASDTEDDSDKEDEEPPNLSSSLLPPSGENNIKEAVTECDDRPAPEIVDAEKMQRSIVKQKTNMVGNKEQCQNGPEERSLLSADSVDRSLASDVALLQGTMKKDAQGLSREGDGPAHKDDGQQSPAENTNSRVKAVNSRPVTPDAAGVEQPDTQSGSVEETSAKSPVPASSCNENNSERAPADPQYKEDFLDEEMEHSLQSDDESDGDESLDGEEPSEKMDIDHLKPSPAMDRTGTKERRKGFKSDEEVDIETVEEFSEKTHITHLKASATTDTSETDNPGTQGKNSKGRKKPSKVTGEDICEEGGDEEDTVHHRQNHTANERKRRSELRDLFEELRNALGLHSLPKASKMYILKQAIDEVMNLTDTADTLIKKKTLLSQNQTQLIKKVSNLSGKPKEVVLKKLEYLYAKQKALETEKQKTNVEEDVALPKASMALPIPTREPFLPLKLGEDSNETQSSKTKKPLILARKTLLLSAEGNNQEPAVSTSNVLVVPTSQVVNQDHIVASIPPTLIQASLNPAQMTSGATSVVIQLPSTIELKGIIGNSPVPLTLSTVPGNIAIATPDGPVSEMDDLSMMPKIVNVTSLAQGAESDVGIEVGMFPSNTQRDCQSFTRTESYIGGDVPAQDASYVTADSCAPSASIPVEDSSADPAKQSCAQFSSLLESVPQESDSDHPDTSIKSKLVSVSNASLGKMTVDGRNSGLEVELKKLTSAIDEAGLDPNELSETVEDADETLTSLLNEIAFLNQQLNKDTDDLDSVSDFPGSDTASHSSVSKCTDGDSSPFSFARFKDVAETKEKNVSFSPLFMSLEEGEIPDSIKHQEETGSMVFEGNARKEPPLTDVRTQSGLHHPPATLLSPQNTDKPVTSCSDVFWRPMPKLAPLGLKAHTVPSDQRVLANKSMPSLASVAVRLSSPKTTD
ncbi:MAX gene-associated protein isoform X2 [Dendropsophus ebraccatus]|uniref:MAX gene-associated protein isoform X2 n=1 Tax=Dendropsophus ebraccatus TaxID=150705 RepID=UPI003831E4D7